MSVLFTDRETGAYGEFCLVESRIKEAVSTFPLPEALGLAIIETKIGTAGQSKPFFMLEICENPSREAVKAQHEKVLSNLRRDGLVYFTRNLTLREGYRVVKDRGELYVTKSNQFRRSAVAMLTNGANYGEVTLYGPKGKSERVAVGVSEVEFALVAHRKLTELEWFDPWTVRTH